MRQIGGQFAICEQAGKTIRMARSIGRPMRYFLAKRAEGPALIIAERIDEIAQQLRKEGLSDQFNPSYTRNGPRPPSFRTPIGGLPGPKSGLNAIFCSQAKSPTR